jgi:hypothetical protein
MKHFTFANKLFFWILFFTTKKIRHKKSSHKKHIRLIFMPKTNNHLIVISKLRLTFAPLFFFFYYFTKRN